MLFTQAYTELPFGSPWGLFRMHHAGEGPVAVAAMVFAFESVNNGISSQSIMASCTCGRTRGPEPLGHGRCPREEGLLNVARVHRLPPLLRPTA